MITLSLDRLSKFFTIPPQEKALCFKGLSTDTRTLQPGNLFIALPGERYDGHAFIEQAYQQGAVAALVQQKVASALPQIVVADTVKALGLVAQTWRQQFDLPIIGLTGSNGKTTTKNMIASILRVATYPHVDAVLATQANFNNHIGVPWMLSQLAATHQYAVIEMGMNHFGEIDYLTRLVRPTIALINNAAPAHLEGVADLAGVAKAKGEIFAGLSPQGIAILNRDDHYFTYWKSLMGKRQFISFGFNQEADVYVEFNAQQEPLKQAITILTPNGQIAVNLPLLGKHNVMNALAATAACVALNIEKAAIQEGLEKIEPVAGRLQLQRFADDICLIDDTYNANPASLQAAIAVLAAFAGDKILILGDMRELGEKASGLHATMGTVIREAGIDYLFTYGELSAQISQQFGAQGYHFKEQAQLVTALKQHLKPHSTYLVKGSRYMKMEKVVAALKDFLQ